MAKRPTIDATFGPLTLSFPNITSPDEKYDVYTANGVDDPNSAAMKSAQAVLKKALTQFGLGADAKLPLTREMVKDPKAPEGAKKPKKVPSGKLILKSKSKRAPAVFDSQGREINPKGLDIRGGTLARVQGFLSPYEMIEKVKVDGEIEEITVTGISFTLTGVQIIRLAQGFGSKGFEAYDSDDGEGWTMGDAGADLPLGNDTDDDADGSAEDDGGVLDI